MKFPILVPNIFNHPFTYESNLNLKVGDYVLYLLENLKLLVLFGMNLKKITIKILRLKM